MSEHPSETRKERTLIERARRWLVTQTVNEAAAEPDQPSESVAPAQAAPGPADTTQVSLHPQPPAPTPEPDRPGITPSSLVLGQQMERIENHLVTAHSKLEAMIEEKLGGLEKQISRAGREQLKANSLNETQLERLTTALDTLREHDTRRDEEMEALRQQMHADQSSARLSVIQALLPALDGIDEALRSGQALLERPITPSPTSDPPTIFERLRGQVPPKPGSDRSLREAFNSWLVGLTYVRQRMLDVLAAEDVHPIEALGQPFDPQHHVVLDVIPASDETPPGVVAHELRRGYMVSERVLRHSEVVVAKADNDD